MQTMDQHMTINHENFFQITMHPLNAQFFTI